MGPIREQSHRSRSRPIEVPAATDARPETSPLGPRNQHGTAPASPWGSAQEGVAVVDGGAVEMMLLVIVNTLIRILQRKFG
jgi:hypothetical protein